MERQRPSIGEIFDRTILRLLTTLPGIVIDRLVYEDRHGLGRRFRRIERAVKWAEEQEKRQDSNVKKS